MEFVSLLEMIATDVDVIKDTQEQHVMKHVGTMGLWSLSLITIWHTDLILKLFSYEVTEYKKWREIYRGLPQYQESHTSASYALKRAYERNLYEYEKAQATVAQAAQSASAASSSTDDIRRNRRTQAFTQQLSAELKKCKGSYSCIRRRGQG